MDNKELTRWLTVRNFAYLYADNNFAIFPVHTWEHGHCSCNKLDCKRPAKHPAVTWATASTIDKRKIDQWWHDKAEHIYNIGIATGKLSGITVVDIDAGSGGLETWRQICEENHIPDTYTVKTGGGGYHLYFKYQAGINTGTNLLGQGIDIRNDGGYIIAPPSIHKSGKTYEIDGDIPLKIELAPWPECLSRIYGLKPSLKPNVKVNTAKSGTLSIKRAEKLLDYIPADDYQIWLNVGIILGREFNRSDEAWNLYYKWADKYDGDKGHTRDHKMQEAFYKNSQEQGNGRGQLTAATLYRLAYANGYQADKKRIPIESLCYIAEENAFIYLVNGGKWTASAVEGMVAPVKDDNEIIKPTTWLINNRSATCVTNSSILPTGLVHGFDVNNGTAYPIETSSIVNLFNKSLCKPLACMIKRVNTPKIPAAMMTNPFTPAGGNDDNNFINNSDESYRTDKKQIIEINSDLPWLN